MDKNLNIGEEVFYHDEESVVSEAPRGKEPASGNYVWIFNKKREYHMCVDKCNVHRTKPDYDLTIVTTTLKSTKLVAARLVHGTPINFRLGRLPDGTLVLQGAYPWTQGAAQGVEWATIPTFDLNASGSTNEN